MVTASCTSTGCLLTPVTLLSWGFLRYMISPWMVKGQERLPW